MIPSGPGRTGNSIYQLLLLSIYSSRLEIVMTTYRKPGAACQPAALKITGFSIDLSAAHW